MSFNTAAAARSQIRLPAECIVGRKDVIYVYKLTDCKYKVCIQRLYGCPLSFHTLTPSAGLASRRTALQTLRLLVNENAD
ncbi:Hypothetical predicted protein [Lynx pardinus]|uniref:Uncharacterized protein n=1 Tax=Lynx pardinus TaxID=191816 RepID=A0A485P8Q1_LYNPA|nr:Hypothetical predicted protein [Lynx pardinus]